MPERACRKRSGDAFLSQFRFGGAETDIRPETEAAETAGQRNMADLGAPRAEPEPDNRSVYIYDCRPESRESSEREIEISGKDFTQFLQAVRKEFSITRKDAFVLTTTDRREINKDIYGELANGKTLHLLQSVDQELTKATQERINYLPHYHTIVQSGQYEYYASEGQKALPYAFAELIDNALSATSRNPGVRRIDIRLLFDESQGGPAVVVMDNGRGMTSKELNNWAVYRLSKFNRENSTFQRCFFRSSPKETLNPEPLAQPGCEEYGDSVKENRSDHSGYVRPTPVPRSLNSDISYFGVGGKQAVFYIGQSVRIISKPVGSPDVHEFVMSKEDFERKEKNKEEIYSGIIRNRKPGDCSHVKVDEERFLQSLILEEEGKDSFTAIVINRIQPEHVTYLRNDFILWTRELAHIYHYYVHGIHGNDLKNEKKADSPSNIDIQICLLERSPRLPKLINLREIDKDMQTLYINSSVAEFEFKASKGSDARVEGLIRYHPFLYDKETYPEDPYNSTPVAENDDDDCFIFQAEGRGKRPIFECFWNGRLIPYSSVNEFEWCAKPKKMCTVPLECYNRISGVLFANDCFQVSTNKLTFMDLELQLRDKETIFTRVLNSQEQRVKISREFTIWLKECHERFDKQVKFIGYHGTTTRTDVSSKRQQSPWARFKGIHWDGKVYKAGQQVKSVKTQPILFGSIVQFLLYGDHEGDVYATGGHVQIALEPQELYNEVRIIPISKIDRQATDSAIKKSIAEELAKLPDQLKVSWPEGNPWPDKAVRPAGTPLGPIQVHILNKKGETMSRLPVSNINAKKLLMELKVIWHSPKGDVQTNSHICMHSTKWEFWFKVMENLNKLGKYTLCLQTLLSDSESASEWAGKRLPQYVLHFTIKESSAACFVLRSVPTSVQVGVPFSLNLEFKDEFDHVTQPPSDIKPQLECSSLQLNYEQTALNGTTFTVQDLRAKGKVTNQLEKVHTVKVIVPGLKQDFQSFQFSVRPGPPQQLVVFPENDISIENGSPAGFKVEVHDEFQNITTHSKLIVRCQLLGAPDLPVDTVDCSNTGAGVLLAKPVQLKNVTTEQVLTAKFGIPNQKGISCVERSLRVLPSTRVFRVEIYRQDSDDVMLIQNLERINWTAGDTLGSLRFRLYDEGGRLVPLTHKLAHNVKVNWTAGVRTAELAKGRLPNVSVPTKVQREHFYQVSFTDQQSVETSFFIIPRPDEPDKLRVTLRENTVKMGETLSENISVEVVDQYGNKTDTLNAENMKTVSVHADDLDVSTLSVDWQESSGTVLVSGVRFTGGSPGSRELCFKYQEFEEFARVKVTAGPPAKITLVEAPEMPLHVLNGRGLDTPFLLQLCDKWENPVPDQRVVIAIKTLSTQLKVKSSVMSRPVDPDGKACFKLEMVTAPKGEHELEFRGSFSRNSIPGPVVKLNVMPDPNNPVKLTVEYDNEAILIAGDFLPEFKVMVVSEEGGPVKNVNPASLTMLLWQGLAAGTRPPPEATNFKCSQQDSDIFYFRDKEIPEQVGKYIVQFVFVGEKVKFLWSSQIALKVVHDKPVRLVPESSPATPVVSNSDAGNRTLLDSLCLKIMDKYNNPAGTGKNGQVVVTVIGAAGSKAKDLPLFEKKAKSVSYKLTEGEATITGLALMENSPGCDGAEYTLQFQPVIEGPGPSPTITPFTLPFRFYNDAENQKVMAEMSKKKDQLSHSIVLYKGILDTHTQLASELESQVRDASSRETQCKSELSKSGIDVSKLRTVSAVDSLIAEKKADMEKIQNAPRRKCTMPDSFKGSPDVLGKIAHLAQVEDDDAAKVISWHILGDMDCVVTVTTAAAKKIYDDTQGRQQVMPLETVFWRPNTRPLPHIRNEEPLFKPLGNPVFVRDLLIFPEHEENCNKVFSTVVGDTILVDDLDSANHYRKGVVQNKVQCPTLLTRQGERIRGNGKFGGLQNKAPPIEKLRGQVFGAPLPEEYHTISKQIELLQQYSVAVQKASEVRADFDGHMLYLKSPEMKQKQRELQDQEKTLKDIEKKLASTPVRSSPVSVAKRNLLEEPDETLPAKRIRRKKRILDS
ncbi:structural maintenance of chromosomes flexible hinge domain-containing protein 1 isoform X1 [Astyanax mexicanus]|uniref:structural maintenance of chromosomes flexible hinge domain-containing protein 1 isoform X1 n=1 Tax=Astyanax mexicanus TaxID=7994 RepID=UPI0020CAB5D8|nr:structural maintenance of chromosomes flexible hinge domain-containing protein 1 isoform X1 [Astyanax mexicanus]